MMAWKYYGRSPRIDVCGRRIALNRNKVVQQILICVMICCGHLSNEE